MSRLAQSTRCFTASYLPDWYKLYAAFILYEWEKVSHPHVWMMSWSLNVFSLHVDDDVTAENCVTDSVWQEVGQIKPRPRADRRDALFELFERVRAE